jgi:hypothetical protein
MDANGQPVQGPLHPFHTTITLDVAAANRTADDALNGVVIVRLCTTESCFVRFGGKEIVAVAGDVYIPVNVPEYFSLEKDLYISCVKTAGGAGTGKLYITPME